MQEQMTNVEKIINVSTNEIKQKMLSICENGYKYNSEIFPAKIRGRAMSIAVIVLWATNFLVSQTFPMMNGNDWLNSIFNHGFPFIIYGLFCVLAIIFVWKYVPETKNKSLEAIQDLWKAK
jgi:SP family xylose:H+ symportor-like MFS transporter